MTLKHLGLVAALALTPAATFAETYNVTVVAGHPPVFRWVRMISESFIPTAQAELEAAGHSITFSEQYGGALAGVGEELEAVEAGLAEMGTCQALFDPAKLAVQNVTYYTPFVSDDVRLIAETVNDLHRTHTEMNLAYAENGVVYLGAPIGIDDYTLMTNFPVTSLDDLKGRKIAAPGAAINWLSGTGAVGVSGNLTTYYNELKAGVYDGVLVFASAALPGKLFEVAPYITKMGLGAQYAGSICANADWFAGLPAEVQTALVTAADAAQVWYHDDLEAFVQVALAKMAEAGATITDASPEMRAAWANGMDNAAKTWAAELDAQGKPASLILGLYMDAMRAAGATPLRDWDKE
ncbi:MAG: C4-dicarboxylate TRAP transporter substrate-binding protein [Rhodobacterales bacterium]|nr:C4-dicarboxylate TRAP transporter substrate-binding protein [Rhodobacterales bacterium]MDX5391409.1 C4-dicarboxylate TRAP transporter substrate-binding protein [Rhodobacterales bacterium]MDX5491109.1 C4-dicarboxylate TRAP transporter substrate-binding protein [Rhodobacterales bacterium]